MYLVQPPTSPAIHVCTTCVETPMMSMMHDADLDGDTDFVVFTNHGSRDPLMVKAGAFLWQNFAHMLNLLIGGS